MRKLLVIMHVLMICTVTIGQVTLTQKVHALEGESSWQTIADTATIKLPKNIRNLTATTFKKGERVSIEIGYQDKVSEVVFNGFVKHTKPNIPFEIVCEDGAYLTRSTRIQKNWKAAVTLKEIVDYLITETNAENPDYLINLMEDIEVPEVNFSKFRIPNNSAYEVLEKLKDEYGLAFYFRDLEMYVGLPYGENVGKVKYNLQYNIVSHDLDYHEAGDNPLKIKAVGVKKDNSKIEVEVGESGGNEITQFYYKIDDEDTLRMLAEQDLRKGIAIGYKGSITGFMIPFVQHSMIAEVDDNDFPNRKGESRVDQVKWSFDKGIRLTSQIGGKVV